MNDTGSSSSAEVTWNGILTLAGIGLTLAVNFWQSWQMNHFQSKCCVKNGRECCSVVVNSDTE